MVTLKTFKSFDYDRIGSFTNMNPYVIAFCYPEPGTSYIFPNDEGFIIKGGMKNVEREIAAHPNVPMIVFMTIWRHGQSRQLNPSFYNFLPKSRNRGVRDKKPWWSKINIRKIGGRSFYRNSTLLFDTKEILTVRRIPRKWIPEYSELRHAAKYL